MDTGGSRIPEDWSFQQTAPMWDNVLRRVCALAPVTAWHPITPLSFLELTLSLRGRFVCDGVLGSELQRLLILGGLEVEEEGGEDWKRIRLTYLQDQRSRCVTLLSSLPLPLPLLEWTASFVY